MGELQDLLAQAPAEHREGIQRLIERQRETMRHYGYECADDEMPRPLSLEEMKEGEQRNAQAIVQEVLRDHRGKRDLDDWFEVWMGSKRVVSDRDLPSLALATIPSDCWTPSEARSLAESAWTLPEWPGQWPRQAWLRVFNEVGFICSIREDGGVCEYHPDEAAVGDETVQVWRGALASAKRGMSWTTDRDRALWFVRRGDMTGQGRTMHLWTAKADPERVLAHFHTRSEDEFVLDPTRMRIHEEEI